MPGTFARMTRRSRSVSPGDVFRTFWNDCQSVASRASTIRLRTPSCSMNASTCCCAPAPIDIIETTARHAEDHPQHGQQRAQLVDHQRLEASQAVGEDLEAGAFREPGGDRRHRPPPGIGPADEARLRALVEDVGVHQRDVGVGGEVLQHDAVFGDADDLHGQRLESRAVAHVDDRLAFLLEQHLARQVRHVGELLAAARQSARSSPAEAPPRGGSARTTS